MKRIATFLIVLLLFSFALPVAVPVALAVDQIIRYVDTAADPAGNGLTDALTGGNHAYQSAMIASEAEKKDIDAADEQWTFILAASTGLPDTTQLVISSAWVTDNNKWLEFVGAPHRTGVWDSSYNVYTFKNDDAQQTAISISVQYCRLYNFQIQVESHSGVDRQGILTTNIGIGVDIRVYNVAVKGNMSGANSGILGIHSGDGQSRLRCFNCTVTGCRANGTGVGYGFWSNLNTEMSVNNCVAYDNDVGYKRTNGTTKAFNCIAGNNDDDFEGTWDTIDYCCTDDADGTNTRAPSGASWPNEMRDPANDDFSIVEGGNCIDNGTDDPDPGKYSTDMVGVSYVSTWSIGAYEDPLPFGEGLMIISKLIDMNKIIYGTLKTDRLNLAI